MRISVLPLGVLCALTLTLAACGGGDDSTSSSPTSGDGATVSGNVVLDGSSTVAPIAEALAEEFGKVSDVKVTVGIAGTSGGFEKFCRGETDISNASRPIKREETQACADRNVELTEFKIAIDGLTVALNPGNTWANCLTFSQLRTIFDTGSAISNWNQVDPSFPDQPMTIFSPGSDSGTFDYLSEEVNGTVDRFRNDALVTFSEDDNVLVKSVQNDPGAIGYFGYAYYKANESTLKAAALDRDITKDGSVAPADKRGCILPGPDTVLNNSYPLSRPLFMYVNNKALAKPQVRAFMEFAFAHPELVTDVGYVGLEPAIYSQNLSKLKATK